jgi:fructose-bisphosphate aldolase class II
MAFVTSKELLADADAKGYGVGAFNAVNMETAQGIFQAAEEERSPLIIQITQTTLAYTEPDELVAVIKALAERTTIPVALHLDHGRSFEVVMRFLRLGMSSVMIDGSLQEDGKTPRSYEENVAVTKQAVAAAHALGVSVEAEIGRLGQVSHERDEALTDPDEAARFVEETGVDLLAIGIGTTHGLYKGTPKIVHERVAEIDKRVDLPLVMHGGTGVPDEDVRKAVERGIRKINIDTEMRVAFYGAVRDYVLKQEQIYQQADAKGDVRKYDIRSILKPGRQAVVEAVRTKMRLFGCAGKA